MGKMLSFRLILFVLIVLLDTYVFFVLRSVTQHFSSVMRNALLITHCALSLVTILLLFSVEHIHGTIRYYIFSILMGVIIAKVIMVIFFLLDDSRRAVAWSAKKIRHTQGDELIISRSAFLSWLGLTLGTVFFGSILLGITNRYNYRIIRQRIKFPNLPPSFQGLRIVHISDIHCGSFNNTGAVARGIEMIMQQKPDLILFTGDLVNDRAIELKNYKQIFAKLKARLGVYSILGNHDYGDYHQWDSPREKQKNLEDLKNIQKEMGWRLLMNEHVVFERNGENIALIGIENWSAKARFPKYGRLSQAYAGTEQMPFKILMSHDPSHWDAQVNTQYKDIDLTLSGHTHGMQFGVEIGRLRWSPVQYVYNQWGGKYTKGNQVLYVNRGFGFLGYMGRVGIKPEITVIELER
ncbi:metallophosphoesterase [Haoranjiania flava]|uniref:Metallophosphoesterase n=1 Tax=Haoranjiania flava TaxID=1856322 RepID=A0AAE3IMX5_9BACT|nr:metallophosphoesterase [Haoranjiania flava]MCU7694869.1 metallophosphoesterase [Haoranjiania flava]